MSSEATDDPSILFGRAFSTNSINFSMIYSIRQVAKLGLPLAEAATLQQGLELAYSILYGEEFKDVFIDREKALEIFGGHEKLAKDMAQQKIDQFEKAIDSTALIFSHSTLDAQAFEYCKITSIVSFESWVPFVANRQLSIAEIKINDYENILKSKIESELIALEKESLLKKIDKMLAICKPPTGFAPINHYSFDRKRIEEFDKARHGVIHGELLKGELPINDDDIWYYMSTGNYLMALVNHRFDIRMDPNHMIESIAKRPDLV